MMMVSWKDKVLDSEGLNAAPRKGCFHVLVRICVIFPWLALKGINPSLLMLKQEPFESSCYQYPGKKVGACLCVKVVGA